MEALTVDLTFDENIFKSTTKNDDIILLNIFPEEVWQAVFKKVKSSVHLLQISNASPFFKKLFFHQRTLILFPKVWKILGMAYETSHDRVYIPAFSSILKLRLVCRLWCSVVDDFYGNLPDIYRMKQDENSRWTLEGYAYGDRVCGQWTRNFLWRWYPTKVNKFLWHFSETHRATDRSPFLANFVSLNVNLDSAQSQMRIFEFYGKHVWHCHLAIQDDTAELFSKLIHLLKLMPNLRSLGILYGLRNPDNNANHELAICANPLPLWPNLKFLVVNNVPSPVFDNLLEMNSHVKMLEVRRENDNVQNMFNIFTHEFSNLVQISLEVYSREYFEQFENCPFKCKLEKIYLNFSKCCYIPWSEIFQMLVSNWAETVTNVALHLPKAITSGEKCNHLSGLSSLQLNLPNLKRLKIVLENASSIDFVLPMKDTLARLEISDMVCWNKEMNCWKEIGFQEIIENQIIDYNESQVNFYFSNIWTMLPALQRLGYENVTGRPWERKYHKLYKRVEWIQKTQKFGYHCYNRANFIALI